MLWGIQMVNKKFQEAWFRLPSTFEKQSVKKISCWSISYIFIVLPTVLFKIVIYVFFKVYYSFLLYKSLKSSFKLDYRWGVWGIATAIMMLLSDNKDSELSGEWIEFITYGRHLVFSTPRLFLVISTLTSLAGTWLEDEHSLSSGRI